MTIGVPVAALGAAAATALGLATAGAALGAAAGAALGAAAGALLGAAAGEGLGFAAGAADGAVVGGAAAGAVVGAAAVPPLQADSTRAVATRALRRRMSIPFRFPMRMRVPFLLLHCTDAARLAGTSPPRKMLGRSSLPTTAAGPSIRFRPATST